MKIEHVSVSRVEKYIQCPYRYYLDYDLEPEERLPQIYNIHLSRGIAAHRAIEKFLVEYKTHGKWDPKRMIALWKDSAIQEGLSLSEIEEGNGKLLLMMKNLIKPEPDNIIGIEEDRECIINDVMFKFSMDFVEKYTDENGDTVCKITDWKTGAWPYSNIQMDNNLQAPIYLYIAKNKLYPGFDKYVFVFNFIWANTEVEYVYTDKHLDAAKDYLVSAYTIIANDDKPKCKPNTYCGYCPGAVYGKCEVAQRFIKNGIFEEEFLKELKDSDATKFVKTEDKKLVSLVQEKELVEGMIKILESRKEQSKAEAKQILKHRNAQRISVGEYTITFKPWVKEKYRASEVLASIGDSKFLQDACLETLKTKVDALHRSGEISDDDMTRIKKHSSIIRTAPVMRVYKSRGSGKNVKPTGEKKSDYKKTNTTKNGEQRKKERETKRKLSTDFWS
jgi:CRISPR/Cas system-associated exonuclease Cas4 (RecB family)